MVGWQNEPPGWDAGFRGDNSVLALAAIPGTTHHYSATPTPRVQFQYSHFSILPPESSVTPCLRYAQHM